MSGYPVRPRRPLRAAAASLLPALVLSLAGVAPASAASPPQLTPPPVSAPAFNEVGLPALTVAGTMALQARSLFERATQMTLSPATRAQAKRTYTEGLSLWRSAQARAATARAEHAAAGAALKVPSSSAWRTALARYTNADIASFSSEARARAALAKATR